MTLSIRPFARATVALLMSAGVLAGGARTASAQAPAAPTNVRILAGSPEPGNATVTVSPQSATIQPGGVIQFTATVTGTTNTSVTWSSTGGSISSTGQYTAGPTAGTFKVIATLSGGSISGSASVTIQASSITADIAVSPGQSIQAAVNSVGEGAVILIKSGVHRLQSIVPRSRQTFVGEPGAILSGARRLTSFTREGTYWVVSGQTQQGRVIGSSSDEVCLSSAPRCGYPEDLYFDNQPLKHVATLSAVGSGSWFFDYASDKIYFADDPTGRVVETSVTPHAFNSGYATGVTIRGLVVEKYASPTHDAAINANGGIGWIVEDNEVRWNHSAGIRASDQMRARRNFTHHNGQFGFIGAGAGILVENNEIAYNNTLGYNAYWGAGGSKWVLTDGLVVRGNFSHHNKGMGLWTDIDNINTLYENNRVEDNDLNGIFHEVSYRAVIRNNSVARNGFATNWPGWMDGGGIVVAHSPDVEVYGNTVTDNRQGIGGIQSDRGSGRYGAYVLRNLNVHDNTVTMNIGVSGIVQNVGSTAVFTHQNNVYQNNTYRLGTRTRYFTWMNGERTESEWRSYGQDTTGTFTR